MVIHLIAPKNQSIWSEIWHKCYKIWKSSPYKIKMWYDEDVDDLIKEDDKDFFKTLNTLDPIYKWDYVRYIILQKFGGAYFDMDVEIIRDFIPLLESKIIYLAEGKTNCFISNHIMISPPNYLIWDGVKNYCKYNILNNYEKCKSHNFWTVEMVGPVALSNYFGKFQPPYQPLSHSHFSEKNSKLSFSKHHYTSVWANTPFPSNMPINYF
jgi:mannosyltransferase OCH1-like enzyme